MQNRSPERIAGSLPGNLVQKLAGLMAKPEQAEIELVGSRTRDLGRLVRAGVVTVPRGRVLTASDVEITDLGWDVIGACAELEIE